MKSLEYEVDKGGKIVGKGRWARERGYGAEGQKSGVEEVRGRVERDD